MLSEIDIRGWVGKIDLLIDRPGFATLSYMATRMTFEAIQQAFNQIPTPKSKEQLEAFRAAYSRILADSGWTMQQYLKQRESIREEVLNGVARP